MQAFEFYCPTKIYFGKGAEARVGEAVKHFGGTKVFIVYGGHSAVKSGLIARIEQTLTDAGLEHMSFGGVQPNPRLSHAREGVQKALAFGADFILGVGGGSVLDALLREGYRVPEDFSLCGFDNVTTSGYQRIQLTTVDNNTFSHGKSAFNLLLERIEGGLNSREDQPINRVEYHSRLIVRGSTGKPRSGGL